MITAPRQPGKLVTEGHLVGLVFAVLFAVGSVAVALEQSFPQALLAWLAEIRWPSLHGQWMSLIQMVYPVFLVVQRRQEMARANSV